MLSTMKDGDFSAMYGSSPEGHLPDSLQIRLGLYLSRPAQTLNEWWGTTYKAGRYYQFWAES